ncbi:MAG: hypothetical protein AVDCRST_MAG26-4000, partial [uncultured Chloroflexia bacterium]
VWSSSHPFVPRAPCASSIGATRWCREATNVVIRGVGLRCWGANVGELCALWLQETQLAGTGDRFRAPLGMEFDTTFQSMHVHRTHSEEQPLAGCTIREFPGL